MLTYLAPGQKHLHLAVSDLSLPPPYALDFPRNPGAPWAILGSIIRECELFFLLRYCSREIPHS